MSDLPLTRRHTPRVIGAHMSTTKGAFIWYDLLTSDPTAAIAFYEHVVGWKAQPMGDPSGYILFLGPEGPVGGTVAMPEPMKKAGASPHWTSNVQVPDARATAAEAKRLGG